MSIDPKHAAEATTPEVPKKPWCQICGVELGGLYCDTCREILADLPAQRPAPEPDALAAQLRAIVTFRRQFREDPSGWFEARAEEFYAETHLIAPGRSVPLAMGGQDEDERRAAWATFLRRLGDEQDATVLEAADDLAAAKAPRGK